MLLTAYKSCIASSLFTLQMSVKGVQFWYIATQGPLPTTVVDFWQMAWEAKVDVIAMLTDVIEQSRQKCFHYWPTEIGPKHRSKFGNVSIVLSKCYNS